MSTDFRAAIGATRAALAHPEGEGLGLAEIDKKELLRVYCDARRAYCHDGPEHIDWQRDAERGATLAGLGAVLTRWGSPTALAQSEGQSMLNVNLKLDTSPECLKRLVDGLTKAVTPNGGYEAATTDDPAPGTGGDQMVEVQWWIPQHGWDSLENTLDAIKYKITCAVTDWFATAMVPAGSEQPEGEGLTNDEAVRRGRPTTPPAPKSRNPTMDEVMGLARSFQLEVSDRDAGALMWLVITAIAVWGDASAAPPAPETGELTTLFAVGASCGGGARLSQDQCARAATLLQQQEARIAGLRSALADCGRVVGASISDDCSDDFLLQVPAEVRLAVAKAAPAVVPVAWCRSDEFTNSMKRGGSFNGWKDPGAGTDKCDMQLYAIPLPQAGEVKS